MLSVEQAQSAIRSLLDDRLDFNYADWCLEGPGTSFEASVTAALYPPSYGWFDFFFTSFGNPVSPYHMFKRIAGYTEHPQIQAWSSHDDAFCTELLDAKVAQATRHGLPLAFIQWGLAEIDFEEELIARIYHPPEVTTARALAWMARGAREELDKLN